MVILHCPPPQSPPTTPPPPPPPRATPPAAPPHAAPPRRHPTDLLLRCCCRQSRSVYAGADARRVVAPSHRARCPSVAPRAATPSRRCVGESALPLCRPRPTLPPVVSPVALHVRGRVDGVVRRGRGRIVALSRRARRPSRRDRATRARACGQWWERRAEVQVEAWAHGRGRERVNG